MQSTKFKDFLRTFNNSNTHFKHQNYQQKPHPRCGRLKSRLQCDTEVYCTVLTSSVMITAGDCFKIVSKCKISQFGWFKFQNFSRIFKYFQAPYSSSSTFKGHENWSFYFKFKHFQGFLKHAMNHETASVRPGNCWGRVVGPPVTPWWSCRPSNHRCSV